jgi:hypothetical protein
LNEKLEILKTLDRKEEGPFFKEEIKIRKKNVISTDISTLSQGKKQRKSSAPYIKPSLQMSINMEGSVL